MLRAFAAADLSNMLATIQVPTLLLYGEADRRSPLNVAEILHKKMTDSSLVIMPGVGHLSNIEAPQIFNTNVRNFLRSN